MTGPIAYLASRYPYLSQTFVLREVEALREQGLDITTVSLRRPEDAAWSAADRHALATTTVLVPPKAAFAAVIDVARHPAALVATLRHAWRRSPPGLRARAWAAFYVAEALLLRAELVRKGIRHVHAHLGNAAADVARLAVRFGNHADGGGWHWSWTMHGPTEFAEVERFDLRGKVEDASLVVCISDYCRSQLMAIVGDDQWMKLAVVHCGVDVDTFGLVERQRSEGDPIRVLCVGQLLPRKGQRILVEAVGMLVESGLDLRLDLAGDGPDRAALEGLVERLGLTDRVRLLGAVSHDDIIDRYAEADLFCLPSFAEGVPVVLMEAMATGLPVVTTPIAGIPELVEDRVTGVLTAPGRADLLADAIAELAKDHVLRDDLGRNGRARVCAEFDARATATRLAGLFQQLHERR